MKNARIFLFFLEFRETNVHVASSFTHMHAAFFDRCWNIIKYIKDHLNWNEILWTNRVRVVTQYEYFNRSLDLLIKLQYQYGPTARNQLLAIWQ